MAKVESCEPGNKRLRGKWWEWLVFAAVLEVYVPSRKGRKMQWWDWVVLAAVVSSAFLYLPDRTLGQKHGSRETTPQSMQPTQNQRVA